MEARVAYNDYIVRVPIGADATRLFSFAQAMGWTVLSPHEDTRLSKSSKEKGLTSLRGVLKTGNNNSDKDMRREAINNKYGLNL